MDHPSVKRTTPAPGGGVFSPYVPVGIRLESWDERQLVFSYRRRIDDPIDEDTRGCMSGFALLLIVFGATLGARFSVWLAAPFVAGALYLLGLALREALRLESRRKQVEVERGINQGRFQAVFDRPSRTVTVVSPGRAALIRLGFESVRVNSWLRDTFVFADAEPWDPDTCAVSVSVSTDVADFLGSFEVVSAELDDPSLGQAIDRLKDFFNTGLSENSRDPRDHLAGRH